jgi:hypothetical protein
MHTYRPTPVYAICAAGCTVQVHGDDQAVLEALQSQAAPAAGDAGAAAAGGEEASNKQQPAAGAAGSSSWLDNFVATADDDSKPA